MAGIFTADNVQAVFTVLTFFGSLTAWLVDRYVRRRKRLSYRVHWDHSVDVTPDVANTMGLAIYREQSVVHEPSIVVLRVENVGSVELTAEAMGEGLIWSFGGRDVVHFEIQDSDPEDLAELIRSVGAGVVPASAHNGVSGLALPPFRIGRRNRFKILVLLSGRGRGVSVAGSIDGGEIVREGRRGPLSRSGLLLGGLTLALGGLAAGLLFTTVGGPGRPPVADCPSPGALSVTGSTAFAPVMTQLATQYQARCPDASIRVKAAGTEPAIEALIAGATADAQVQSNESSRIKLVMADDYPGRPGRDPRLGYWPVGIAPFAVVVNAKAGVSTVSTAQLRRLYAGQVQRWDDPALGGGGLDVVLVSRKVGSGTRDTFANRVLGTTETAPESSTDCLSRDIPGRQADVRHCELDTTAEVLNAVASTPGAIGYASAAEAAGLVGKGLVVASVDGYAPTRDSIASGRYKFWAVERLYRFGRLVPPSLRDRFVQYVAEQHEATAVLESAGFFRCTDPAFTDGEAANACLPQVVPATTTPPSPPA